MANINAVKRPKPGDNEEELLRLQEEFLQTRQNPSAKLVNANVRNKNETDSGLQNASNAKRQPIKISEFKKLKTQQGRVSTSQSSGSVVNPKLQTKDGNSVKTIRDMVNNVPINLSNVVLGNIVERKHNVNMYEFKLAKTFPDISDSGFPKVFVSDSTKNEGSGSLFWQKVSKEKEQLESISNSESRIGLSEKQSYVDKEHDSAIVEGSWAQEIHTENVEKLKQMTVEEILQEKSKIEATLNPELIRFLKNRRNRKKQMIEQTEKNAVTHTPMECDNGNVEIEKKNTNEGPENKSATQPKQNVVTDKIECSKNEPMDCNESGIKLPQPPVEILEEAKKKGWVHMNSIEPEKLKWMEDIQVDNQKEPNPEDAYVARFDFNGVLLPFKDESVTVEKGLHHHGEEPERPGYSLQELLQLCRSSIQQQRCTALTTLANILEKSRTGWYDKVLEPAPLVALSQRNVLLLLRFSLDDTSIAIVTATLQALRAFLYSEVDEICLDTLYGWKDYEEPDLPPPPHDVEDTSNLKDHELTQLDAIAAALRTDIVLRIRYILSEMKPTPVGVTCALEILIRLARHSRMTALNIACTPNLLDVIVQNFIPLSTDRLVTERIVDNAYGTPMVVAVRLCRILISYAGKPVADRLANLKIVQSLLSYITSDTGKAGIKLGIESLRLWKLLLLHNVAIDSVSGAQLTLLSQLRLLLTNHDIGNAGELQCEYATTLMDVSTHETSLQITMSLLLAKWSTQLLSIQTPTNCNTKLIIRTLLATRDKSALCMSWLKNVHIFSHLCSTSNLLSDVNPATDREPTSLPSLGVITQSRSLQPIIQSCIPFLACALNFFYEESMLSEVQSILSQPDFCKYLGKLVSNEWNLERSWYTRMEFHLLIGTVKAAHMADEKLNSSISLLIWKLAIKLISALPSDDPANVKAVLEITLSNDRSKLEIMINQLTNLYLDESIRTIKIPTDVSTIYHRYISTKGSWNQPAMPQDWIYLPLVHIYTDCKNNIPCTSRDEETIITVLSLELLLPNLGATLSPTLRFSRLILVYLCETVYLNENVSFLLSKVISLLLKKHHKKLDFTSDLPGLNSFTDLFTGICEHFCSSSYGDHSFGMVMLVPAAQRHDVHYRKLLWSEHAGTLRYLRLPLEKLAIPLEEYLSPAEEDVSLIDSYLTSLVRGTVKKEWCPVPFAIALHHSAMYLKRSTKLANRMRAQVEKLQNKELARTLLLYEPAVL